MSKLQDFADEKKKELKKKIIKWTTTTVLPFVLVVMMAVASVVAVLSAIVGVILFIFDPLIKAEQYQTEAVYASIRNYGGAYKMYDLSILTNKGLSSSEIEKLFGIELQSYDSEIDTMEVPVVKDSDYAGYEKSAAPSPDEATSSSITVDWNIGSYLYPYRLQWQYILALTSIKCYENEEEFEKMFNEVADKLDEDGKVKESEDLALPITEKNLDDAEQSVISNGLGTEVEYFTNYVPNNAYENAYGTDRSGMITSGFSFSKYCAKAFDSNTRRYETDNFDSNGVCGVMKYSTAPGIIDYYADGNSDGKYAYVTRNGYLYPALLVKSASSWLCYYSDFDYEKIKDGSGTDTKYILTTYKKTYRIGDLIKQWDSYGIDSSMREYLFMMMDMFEESLGGTTGTELRSAYDYYMKNGKEMQRVYVNPTYVGYVPSSIEKTDDLEDTYGYELAAKLTDANGLKEILRVQQNGTNVQPDVNIGMIVSQALYDYNVVYQERVDNEDGSFAQDGYHANAWNDNLWMMEPTWGAQAHATEQGSDGATKSSRVGLSSAGFINYILRLSIFREDFGIQNAAGGGSITAAALGKRPTMTQIYRESNYKFRTVSELRPGDIGILKTDTDNEYENVIGYYVGEAGGMHIFYAMCPPGTAGSTGTVQKLCLKGEKGISGITECDITYFCRYYYGANGNIVKQYRVGTGKKIYARYDAVRGAFATFEGETHMNHIDYQNDFINAVMNEPGKYGCEDYADVVVLKHISGGIMPGGVGDDEDIGTFGFSSSSDSVYERLHANELLIFPVDENSFTITSWVGYRDLFTTGQFHAGMDIACNRGEPVYATADGVITVAVTGCYEYSSASDTSHFNEGGGYGNHVVIDHGESVLTLYGHLMMLPDNITSGVTVTQGQLIGYVGSSGSSTGPHLHFEVRDGGYYTGYDGFGYSTGQTRPEYDHNYQIDPYQFYPWLAGTTRVSSDIYYTRPEWFIEDININNSPR